MYIIITMGHLSLSYEEQLILDMIAECISKEPITESRARGDPVPVIASVVLNVRSSERCVFQLNVLFNPWISEYWAHWAICIWDVYVQNLVTSEKDNLAHFHSAALPLSGHNLSQTTNLNKQEKLLK